MLSDICNIATVNLGWYRRSFRSLIWGDEESAVFYIIDNYIFIKFHIFKIKNPLAKGLALGTASHAIGTARAIEMGPVEGAMSSLAVAVAGLLTVIFVSGFAQLI